MGKFWKDKKDRRVYKKMFIKWKYIGSIEIIKEYWLNAKTITEFKELVKNDLRLENNQGYWELFKEDTRLVINYLNKKEHERIETYSDIGSLKVGNKDFTICIPNGMGDGTNYVYIINEDVKIPCLKFITTMSGENFEIYDYDCGNNVIKRLSGRYAIYNYNGIFAIVKWNK